MKKSAFTLIELLVVIAILAILVAILFPVVAHLTGWDTSTAQSATVGARTGLFAPRSADSKESVQQEKMAHEMAAQVGLPGISKFAEKRLLKQILEMRDQGVSTYTYVFCEREGTFRFLGHSIGFGIPAATQYTSPEKLVWSAGNIHRVPQADPNGLFSPAAADATWILLKDPNADDVKPVYIEPKITVSPFPLPDSVLASNSTSPRAIAMPKQKAEPAAPTEGEQAK